MRIIVSLFLVFGINFLFAQEGGYSDRMSVEQGGQISFYISTKVNPYTLTISRFTDTMLTVLTVPNLIGTEQNVPDNAYAAGCGWNVSYTYQVPDNLEPGAYNAGFKTSINYYNIVFFVKSKNPGAYSKNLFIASTNTWQAYNPYGGKSIYDYNSTGGKRSYKVSMLRPSQRTAGYPEFVNNERLAIRWLYTNNITSEFATDYDLYFNPGYLNNFKVVFIVGHSEYWTYEQREQIENFINSGGKVIAISGNNCWWQARFEDNGNTLVCYKDTLADPLKGVADSLVTYNWVFSPINKPENKFLGTSFLYGGYVNNDSVLPWTEGYGDYAAFNTWHWVFNQTGLHEGEEFGFQNRIVGNEVDGVTLKWDNGVPVPLPGLTPPDYKVLGISPAKSSYFVNPSPNGVMGIYYNKSGGALFNAASINFSAGLNSDYFVSQILMNIYLKFNSGTMPPEITSWSPSISIDTIINKSSVKINSRESLVKNKQNYTFNITAKDILNRHLDYRWFVNNVPAGESNSFKYSYDPSKQESNAILIKGVVNNNEDSASINWKIYKSELAFSELPPPFIKKSFYKWRIQIYNAWKDQLQINYTGPSWLTLNNGFLSGFVPDADSSYSISLTVKNNHGQTDQLNTILTLLQESTQGLLHPEGFVLYQNYPNPFNPETRIEYNLYQAGNVSLKVYDLLGREAATIVNAYQEKGNYSFTFNGRDLASGVYFYRIITAAGQETKKLIIQR